MDIEKYFTNPLEDPRIIDSRALDFAIDSKIKLITHNTSHQYDTMIADLETAITNLQNKLGSKEDTKGHQYASTIDVVAYKRDFIKLVRRTSSNVTTKYDKDGDVYTDFFPLGYGTYTKPRIGKIVEYTDHFLTLYTAHPELGTALPTDLAAFKSLYNPARTTQQTNMSNVKNLIAEESAERQALNFQLGYNITFLANQFHGQPEKAKEFFNQNLLYKHPYGGESPVGEVFIYKLKPLEIINTKLRGITDKAARFISHSSNNLVCWTASSLKNPTPGINAYTLAPDGDVVKNIDTLGDKPTNKYLYIQNLGDTEVEIEVELQGKPR